MMSARLLQKAWRLSLPRIGGCGTTALTPRQPRVVLEAGRSAQRGYATNNNNRLMPATASNVPLSYIQCRNIANDKQRRERVEPTFEVQLTRLETNYKQHGYLNYEQCQKLIQLLPAERDAKQALTPEQAHFLLGACVPELLPSQSAEERLTLFRQLWQHLARCEQLSVAHYQTQLRVLRENQVPLVDFHAFLTAVGKHELSAANQTDIYAALLDVACACGDVRQAKELIAEMRAHGYALNEHNFGALILGHARARDMAGAQTVLDSMKAAGVPLSTDTYTLLTLAHLENEETSKAREQLQRFHGQFEAHQLLEIMRAALHANVPADLMEHLVRELPRDYVSGADVPVALRSLCIELLYKRQVSHVRTIIATLPKPQFNENQNVDSFGTTLLLEMFRAQLPSEQIIEIAQLLHTSGKNTRALHLAAEFALRRQPATAIVFLEELDGAGEQLRPHYFWPLFAYNVRRQGESGVMQTLRELQRLKVPCDEETIKTYVLPNIWITLDQPQLALKQLDECGIRTSQVLPGILVQLLQQQKIDEVQKLCDLFPTRIELGALVQPLAALAVHMRATKRYQRFAKLIQALSKKSADHKYDFVGMLLLHMLAPQTRLRGDLPALLRFLNEMSRCELKISAGAAEAVLGKMRQSEIGAEQKVEDMTTLAKTLQQMRNTQLSLPQSGGGGGGGAGVGVGAGNASSFVKHPREMSLDELECHLIELESKQLNTRGVLRRLLQLCVRDNRLARAREIKAKCDELRVQTSPGMLASIFDMYIKLKDLKMAQASLAQLQQKYPAFQIDEHKLIDYASLLLAEGEQLDAAKEVLRQHAARGKVNGGDYVLKNVWQLLNNVAQYAAKQATTTTPPITTTESTTTTTSTDDQQPRNLTYEIFLFLHDLRFCNSHNAVLGPIVREWLLRGDIVNAVNEFRRLAEQYKHTPLQFELLSLLVRLSNGDAAELARYAPIDVAQAQQLLSIVTGLVTRVHGAVNMNSALLLAFAESGTDNQLRRLVINPEFCINHELLVKNCEHLGQEGAVRTLLRLARGVRGLQRVINEQLIYDMLLTNFTRANNYEAALDLFERLEAEDELKVSQQFLRNLVSLLKVNNVEIPSNIALRAQVM